jgi:uncharacterized protein YndB with AHSA1/START domain
MRDALKPDGEVVDKQTVRFRRLLPGPIERVWAYLTEPDKRAKWFAGGAMELREGGKAELFFQHANLMQPGETAPEKYAQAVTGMSFTVRVTRCEPPRLLAYDWFEEDGKASEVVFELEPQGDQVVITLTHRGLQSRAAMRSTCRAAGTCISRILDHVLKGTQPPRFWETIAELEAGYARLIP